MKFGRKWRRPAIYSDVSTLYLNHPYTSFDGYVALFHIRIWLKNKIYRKNSNSRYLRLSNV